MGETSSKAYVDEDNKVSENVQAKDISNPQIPESSVKLKQKSSIRKSKSEDARIKADTLRNDNSQDDKQNACENLAEEGKVDNEKQTIERKSSGRWSMRRQSKGKDSRSASVVGSADTPVNSKKSVKVKKEKSVKKSEEEKVVTESTKDKKLSKKSVKRSESKKNDNKLNDELKITEENIKVAKSPSGKAPIANLDDDDDIEKGETDKYSNNKDEKQERKDGAKPMSPKTDFYEAETLPSKGNINRSKSMEMRDKKKIFVFVKEDEKEKSASMRNLKTSTEKLPEEAKKEKVATVIMSSKDEKGSERITVIIEDKNKKMMENSKNTTVKSVVDKDSDETVKPEKPLRASASIKTEKSVVGEITVEKSPCKSESSKIKQVAVNSSKIETSDVQKVTTQSKSTSSLTRPSIVVTPAYETEMVVRDKSNTVRQTAMVTVSRELVTVSSTPPAPLSSPTSAEPLHRIQVIKKITPAKMVIDSEKTDERKSVENKKFKVVEMNNAASQEHKLLQVTMHNVCQKATQLQTLMSSIQALLAGLETQQKLQLISLADREREMIATIKHIADILRDDLESKTGANLRLVSDRVAEGNLQLTTFQSIIDSGNALLARGSTEEVIRKERELTSHLKVLDKHLRELQNQPIGDHVDDREVIFMPGTTDNLELKSMFGELIVEEDDFEAKPVEKQRLRGPDPELCWSDNPWIPYFKRNVSMAKTGNELMNARIREEICLRNSTRLLNMACPKHFTGFMVELLEVSIDNEMKMKSVCEIIVDLASCSHLLSETLALVCRCISSISVLNDSHQESRQSTRSTILNFVDRFCMRRYQIGASAFLASGMTPAISRSGSYNALSIEPRSSSLSGRNTLTRGSRTPQLPHRSVNAADPFSKFGSWRAGSGLKPQSASSTLTRDAVPSFNAKDDDEAPNEIERRYSNLAILRFVCEMFKLKICPENAIHEWIQRLSRVDDEEAIEAICFIMMQIGRFLDHKRAQHIINKVFVQLTYTGGREGTPGRIKALTKEVIELRENEWIQKRRVTFWQFLQPC